MILGLGDCNMLGADKFDSKSYIGLVEKTSNKKVINCAHTMTTSREGLLYFRDNYEKNFELVVVAYGLVDAWKTFKYAPYVLYYPDNFFRKFGRKIVKKYKKISKRFGLNELLGTKNVVSLDEYKKNIEFIVKNSRRVLLIETAPRLDFLELNRDIKKYNSILSDIALEYKHVEIVEIYKDFEANKALYFDSVHFNESGHLLVAKKIADKL